MKNKLLKILVVLVLSVGISTANVIRVEAASGSISGPSSLTIGSTGSISITTNAPGGFYQGSVSVDGNSAVLVEYDGIFSDVGESRTKSPSSTIKIKGVSIGVTRFNVNISGEDLAGNKFTASRTITVNVTERSSGGTTGGGGTTGNGSTGSYKPLAPKETEAEQKAREEAEAKAKLEAEKKIPLVESIDFFSESERLKGEQVLSVKTENDTFKYSVTLPRNIEAFKLDLKPAGEDVTLEYEKMFKLDEGHDKVEIKAVATKGEITQEYNISVNRYKESELTYDVGDEKYNLLVDTLIDEKLDALGIKKHLVDSEKNKDAYYYQYEGLKFVLTYDSKGIAHFFFVDDQAQLAKEFILFSDEGNKPHFIVDVELEEPGTIRRNKYEKSAIDLPEFITNLDASTEFYNSVSHWKFDETGIITHELKVPAASDEAVAVDYNDVEQVYIGEGRIVSAFVNFDDSNQNMMYLAITLGSLLAVTLGIFVVYWRNTNKRINKILKRND